MMFPIKYNGDILSHNARVGVDGGIVESLDFVNDFSEQTKRVNISFPLLDVFGDAAAAYSLRKLRTAYTGSAIQVRRSSDNATQNIGFDSSGNLDTAALSSFVGAGNGAVSIWYDQSGNNRNVSQNTITSQPIVVINSSIGGKSSLQFNGGNTLFNNTFSSNILPVTCFISYRYTSISGFRYVVEQGLDSRVIGYISGNSGYNESFNGVYFNYTNLPIVNNKNYLAYVLFNDVNSQMNFNNAGVLTGNSGNRSANAITIGSRGNGIAGFIGLISEYIIYISNQSTNRAAIESNINSYYQIY